METDNPPACRRRKKMKKQKMQKVLFIVLLPLVISLISCNSKNEEEANQKIAELSDLTTSLQNQISDLENEKSELLNKIAELNNLNNDLSAELKKLKSKNINLSDEELYENHEIAYSLKFENGGFNTKIYTAPQKEDEIYTIEKDDEILITNIVRVKENDEVFLKVKLLSDSVIEGYVYLNGNPYKNGDFEKVQIFDFDGAKIQTLKLDSTFLISEGTYIREYPSKNSKNLHEISHAEGSAYYKSYEITSDYQWVKITLGEYTGWVPASALHRDVGGPTIYTPEKTIYWELIGSNLI